MVDERFELEQHAQRVAKSQARIAQIQRRTMSERAKNPHDPVAHPTFIMRSDRQLLAMAFSQQQKREQAESARAAAKREQLRAWALEPLPAEEQQLSPADVARFRHELLRAIVAKGLCTAPKIRAEFEERLKVVPPGDWPSLERVFESLCSEIIPPSSSFDAAAAAPATEHASPASVPTEKGDGDDGEEVTFDFELESSDDEAATTTTTAPQPATSSALSSPPPEHPPLAASDWMDEMDELNDESGLFPVHQASS